MKIWVPGAQGMLGEAVCREIIASCKDHTLVGLGSSRVDISNLNQVKTFITKVRPDFIINCAGRIRHSPLLTIKSNAMGPRILAAFEIPMIHMSTDCVFGHTLIFGKNLYSKDLPTPVGIYGLSKALGEVKAAHVLNVRGSFIGRKHGFFAWLLGATGTIDVWKAAYWNGTSVQRMAKELVKLIGEPKSRTIHVASETNMTKAMMAKYIVEKLNLPVSLNLVDEPKIWRVLEPDVKLPPVEEMLEELCNGQ